MTVTELRKELERLEREGYGHAVVMVSDDGQECDIQDAIAVEPRDKRNPDRVVL